MKPDPYRHLYVWSIIPIQVVLGMLSFLPILRHAFLLTDIPAAKLHKKYRLMNFPQMWTQACPSFTGLPVVTHMGHGATYVKTVTNLLPQINT